jgi:hypothetical protein
MPFAALEEHAFKNTVNTLSRFRVSQTNGDLSR